MKIKDLAIGLFAALLLILGVVLWLMPSGLRSAPDVALTTLSGEQLRLSELRGQPVLVTFWATDCPGCRKEMPHLVDLYEELHPKGFELIAIAMAYDPPNRVLEMQRRRELPYRIVLDLEGEAARAFDDVRLTPTSFLIAPDGRIVQHTLGEMNMAEVEQIIRGMLTTG